MMDRARGRTSGGPVSAPRRPRTTGFKDSPAHDEDETGDEVHNSRLRERIKKDSLVSVISGTTLRNKRKRQEAPAPAPSHAADEPDESSDESDGAGSDDDDDPPPPPIPRWPVKSRPSSKFAEEGIGLDLPAVPRKARSAIAKRNLESQQANASTSSSHHNNSSSPAPAAGGGASASYNAATKPGRRMKPNGTKPKPSKAPKPSPAPTPAPPISEQEVEVAEALFDLARMPPNFHAKPENRSESRAESSRADRVSASPARGAASSPAHPPASAPTTTTPLSPPLTSHSNAHAPASSHPAEAPRRKRPRLRPRSDESSRAAGGDPSARFSTERKIESGKLSPGPAAPIGAAGSSGQTFAESCDKKAPENVADVSRPERKAEASTNADLSKRKLASSDSRPAKLEIDLMALPLQNDSGDCNAEFDRQEPMELQTASATTELYWLDKERDRLKEKEGKMKEDVQEENELKKEVDVHMKEERECLDLNKQGNGGLRPSKAPKIDAKVAPKPDRSVSAAVVSAASSFLNASSSACNTTPTMSNWPTGYYAPPPAAVAAAAAQAAVLPPASNEENNPHSQVLPYLASRQSWKRCAIHVFIARFIDLQQQLARHSSLISATFGYGGKPPYNLNMPAENVFGSGANVSSSNAAGSTASSGLPLGGNADRNAQGKSGAYMDAMFRKQHPAQQQQQPQQSFGFPVNQTMSANASGSAGSQAGLSAAGSAPGASSSSAGAGNSNVVSMAAQAQFFQAVMQQNAFPFSFPASPFGQNIGQQAAAQFVNNPFYASHMVPQQQGQAPSNAPQKRNFLGAGQAQQLAEKDNPAREAGENKMLQRLMFGQQQPTSNGGPNLNAPVGLGGDSSQHSGKAPMLQQGAGAPMLGQHGMMNQQAPQPGGGSAGANRGVGPGPLGLAPVAAVMAPQGHAVLQDPGRLQQHLHAMQQPGQQQIYEGGGGVDDRKMGKRSSIPRVDLETLPSMPGSASPTSASSSRMVNGAINLLPAGRLQQSQSGASSPVHSSGQNMKQAASNVRLKAPLSGGGAPVDRNSMMHQAKVYQAPPQQQQQQQQQQQHVQMKNLSQRPASVAPASGVPANPGAIPKVQQARSPQAASSPASRVPPGNNGTPGSVTQPQKQVPQKNCAKPGSFPLASSQKPAAAPVVSGKRPAAAPGNPPMQNATSQVPPAAKVIQPQQQMSSSPTAQYQAHLSQQMQKQSLPAQVRQPFLPQQYPGLLQQQQMHAPQQAQQLQGSPANGLSMAGQVVGGGVVDCSKSAAPPSTRVQPAGSPVTSQRVILHQSNPMHQQQQQQQPAPAYLNGKSSEQKNGLQDPSVPMKTSASGLSTTRQQQQQQQQAKMAGPAAVSFSNVASPQQQQQQQAVSTMSSLVAATPIAVAAAAASGAGASGLSSASPLR